MATKKDDKSGKNAVLEQTLKQIEKQFGKGAIMKLGEGTQTKISALPSGSIKLDKALGIGGYPKGRIIEMYGHESSGKTTFALHAIAETQKQGGQAVFIDAEHALDPEYAKNIGIDIDELLIAQPDTGEEALEIAEALVRSSAVDIIVIDSVAALVPRAEIEGDMGDSHVGILARLMSQAMRKLAGIVNKSNCTVIFINQIREKVGVIFGNPEVTPGGRALKFFSSVRIEIRRGEQLKLGTELVGNAVKVKIVKNKVAPPFKALQLDIIYGKGISQIGEILDLAIDYDSVSKSGAWFSYGDQRLGQGRENTKKAIEENKELYDEIRGKVIQAINPKPEES